MQRVHFLNLAQVYSMQLYIQQVDQANLPLSEAKGRGGGGRSITRFFSQERKIKFFTWKNSKFYQFKEGEYNCRAMLFFT